MKPRDAGDVYERMMKQLCEIDSIVGIRFEGNDTSIANNKFYLLCMAQMHDYSND